MYVSGNQGQAFRRHHYKLQVQPTVLLTLCIEYVFPSYLEDLFSALFTFFLKYLVQGIIIAVIVIFFMSNTWYTLCAH